MKNIYLISKSKKPRTLALTVVIVSLLIFLFTTQLSYATEATCTIKLYSGTGDGHVNTGQVDFDTWDGAHDATIGEHAYPSYTSIWSGARYASSIDVFGIARAFLPFNTSVLPDGASVNKASLFLMPYGRNTTDDDQYTYIQPVGPNTPSSTTTLSTADYDQAGTVDNPTLWSDIKNSYTSSWSDGTYFEFPLNSNGIAGITGTSTTVIGIREGHDIEDVAPNSGGDNEWGFYPAEYSTENKRPYLELTYTIDL